MIGNLMHLIHFHYQLALEVLKNGADCLRLNPGNIRDKDRVKQIAAEAKVRNVPIRIGVNFGSLPPVGGIGKSKGISRHKDGVNLLSKGILEEEYTAVDHMVATGLWEIDLLEKLDFDLIKISLKGKTFTVAWWLYSDSEIISPAKKAPKARDKPTEDVSQAIAKQKTTVVRQ